MGVAGVEQIVVSKLKRISVEGGDVLHGIKQTDTGFIHFGEVYFSSINFGSVKGWKQHTQMTLNLIVPVGLVHFAFVDNVGKRREERVGTMNYARLTVPPNIWFAFRGIADPSSLIMNLADIPHDPTEINRKDLDQIYFDWGM
jgi:dTDP-4-dehydrorhamnose 3,5-epimerase